MSMTDPVADLLTRIRNAHLAKHDRLDVPSSKLKLEVCKVLEDQGFIEGTEILKADDAHEMLRVRLKYSEEGLPIIRHIQRVSKPGRRVYRSAQEIRPVLNGIGVGIISTNQGLLTDREARERRVGGEILAEVW